MTGWADLDKLQTARPRHDGRATFVVRDDRPRADIEAARPLSIVVAICRVARARQVIDSHHGGHGAVYYVCPGAPEFLVEAVSAAGGTVFDGQAERTAPKALETTVQLDAACCDLATAVRRRLGAKSFDDALTIREADLRRAPIDRADPAQLWPAVLELAALAGELLREGQPARWITVGDRPPIALELGKDHLLQPGKLALALAEGGAGSMRMLLALERATATDVVGRTMPLLTARTAVPLERVTWEPLLAAEVDHPDVPVVAYVEDRGEHVRWPSAGGPTPELRASAARNLAAIEPTIEQLPLPFGRIALVSGHYYAAEKLLDPAFMKRVASHIGAGEVLIVATPARGELLALDATTAMIDDGLLHAFAATIARAYDRATARDRISKELIVYQGKPLGRVT